MFLKTFEGTIYVRIVNYINGNNIILDIQGTMQYVRKIWLRQLLRSVLAGLLRIKRINLYTNPTTFCI